MDNQMEFAIYFGNELVAGSEDIGDARSYFKFQEIPASCTISYWIKGKTEVLARNEYYFVKKGIWISSNGKEGAGFVCRDFRVNDGVVSVVGGSESISYPELVFAQNKMDEVMRPKLVEFEQDLWMDGEHEGVINDIRSKLQGQKPKTQLRFQPVIGTKFSKIDALLVSIGVGGTMTDYSEPIEERCVSYSENANSPGKRPKPFCDWIYGHKTNPMNFSDIIYTILPDIFSEISSNGQSNSYIVLDFDLYNYFSKIDTNPPQKLINIEKYGIYHPIDRIYKRGKPLTDIVYTKFGSISELPACEVYPNYSATSIICGDTNLIQIHRKGRNGKTLQEVLDTGV